MGDYWLQLNGDISTTTLRCSNETDLRVIAVHLIRFKKYRTAELRDDQSRVLARHDGKIWNNVT